MIFLIVVTGIILLWVVSCAIAMYIQEKKSFGRVSVIKAFTFSITWMGGSFFLSLPALIYRIVGMKKRSRESSHYFGGVLARFMHRTIFQSGIVKGIENIPMDKSFIIVANHQSTVDIAVLYALRINFSWVSKASVFTIPGVGQLMWLAEYVSLQRGNKESGRKMFEDCRNNCLSKGWSVIIFPQGTRRRHKILDFKMGAFRLAQEAKVPIVPVTIELPENMYQFGCKDRSLLTIHEAILPDSPLFEDIDKLQKFCFEKVIFGLSYGKEMWQRQLDNQNIAENKKIN